MSVFLFLAHAVFLEDDDPAVSGEQDGYGPGGVELREEHDGDGHDRHAQKHARYAPDGSPEGQGQKHDQGTDIQGGPQEAGLQDVPYQELHGGNASGHADEGNQRALKLHQGKHGGDRGGHDGADGGDVVEKENEKRPEGGVVQMAPVHDEEAQKRRHQAGYGLDADVFPHGADAFRHDAAQLPVRRHGGEEELQLASEISLLHEEEDDVDQDQKGVFRHVLQGGGQRREHAGVVYFPYEVSKSGVAGVVETLRGLLDKELQLVLIDRDVFHHRGNVADHDGAYPPHHARNDAQGDDIADEGRQGIAFDANAFDDRLQGVYEVPQADGYDQRQKDSLADLQDVNDHAERQETQANCDGLVHYGYGIVFHIFNYITESDL